MKPFSKEKLVEDLKNIGVKKGDILHLKVSMRAIGKVEGGADTLLQALIEAVGEEGTLVSDAFINVFALPLSNEDSKKIADDKTPSYAGVFANKMIQHPKSFRSKHPIQKFSAIGAKAEEYCTKHNDKTGGYALLDFMMDDDAKNLTIGGAVAGVGTTHVAIERLGFVRQIINKGVNYKADNGEIKFAKVDWNGGCGDGFRNFIPLYYEKGGILNSGKIGNSETILTSMNKTIEIEMDKLKEDNSFFFCSNPACYSCRMSWNHSDKNKIKFVWAWLKKNYKGISFNRFKIIYKSILKKK